MLWQLAYLTKNALIKNQIISHWNRGENQGCSAIVSSSWWRNGYTTATGIHSDWNVNGSWLYLLCKGITHSFADRRGRNSHREKSLSLLLLHLQKDRLKHDLEEFIVPSSIECWSTCCPKSAGTCSVQNQELQHCPCDVWQLMPGSFGNYLHLYLSIN